MSNNNMTDKVQVVKNLFRSDIDYSDGMTALIDELIKKLHDENDEHDRRPKWSPGPWGTSSHGGMIFDTHGDIVASARDIADKNRRRANSFLIASAPELYNTLSNLADLMNPREKNSEITEVEMDALYAAEDALHKALTGEERLPF